MWRTRRWQLPNKLGCASHLRFGLSTHSVLQPCAPSSDADIHALFVQFNFGKRASFQRPPVQRTSLNNHGYEFSCSSCFMGLSKATGLDHNYLVKLHSLNRYLPGPTSLLIGTVVMASSHLSGHDVALNAEHHPSLQLLVLFFTDHIPKGSYKRLILEVQVGLLAL